MEWTLNKRITEGSEFQCRNLRLREDGSAFLDQVIYDVDAPVQDFMQTVRVSRFTDASSPDYNKAEMELVPPINSGRVRYDPQSRRLK